MPTVPRVTQRSVLSGPSSPPMRSTQMDPGAFGSIDAQSLISSGEVVSNIGDVLTGIIAKQNKEDNAREAKKLEVEYNNFIRELAYGDGTEENLGFYAAEGENAISAYPDVRDAIKKKREELAEAASNDAVRSAFSSRTEERTNTFLDKALTHTVDERIKANDAQTEAVIKESVDDAAAAWNDTDVLNRSLSTVTDEMAEMADRNGWSEEIYQSKLEEQKSATIAATVRAASRTDNEFAKELFLTYTDQIDGTTRSSLREELEARDRQLIQDRERAERIQDKVVTDLQDKEFAALTVEIARGNVSEGDIVRKLDTGDIRSSQYFQALEYSRKELADEGDEEVYVDMRLSVLKGESSYDTIMQEDRIDEKMREELINLQDQVERRGGIMARDDVIRARESLERYVVGELGPFAKLDFNESQRLDNALTEFNDRVLAGENVRDVLEDVRRGYSPQSVLNPASEIQNIRRPRYWNYPYSADKTTMTTKYRSTLAKTIKNKNNMSSSEYARELEVLQRYKELIDRMPAAAEGNAR